MSGEAEQLRVKHTAEDMWSVVRVRREDTMASSHFEADSVAKGVVLSAVDL